MGAVAGYRIILASGSPRRREIMTRMGLAFTVVTSGVDETVESYDDPPDFALQLARRKALAVAATGPVAATGAAAGTEAGFARDALVIGCDTIVELDGNILGKPTDEQDATRMLRALRGRTHRVITAVVVVHGESGTDLGRSTTTAVTMRDFGDDELAAYVASGEPFDKAGSYAIQGAGGALVAHYDGAYDNVVGLPADVVVALLRDATAAASSHRRSAGRR
ncbi:septum formation protein Maf [Frankia sp. R43]|uniref:Maf family protein n=1 Tax=Frankia sp. R43 TaxID=269536 RepID=UPI0006CA1716|nr:Maf family protein [Frankia sp. R43]KPM54217.1 septum formation protein Maf [Frankia sp. R43]